MKIIVSQKNLKKALSLVDKIVSKNSSLPILSNILIKTENGRLRLSATNLEIGINSFIGVKIDEPGEIAVPARIFSDFISNIDDDKINLSVKNNILSIGSDKYKTQILGFNSKDFPIIPKLKSDPFISINSKILKNALASVIDSASLSESRPELAGIYCNFMDKKAYFASTDSFRLSEKILNHPSKNSTTFILPRNTTLEIIRITGDIEGELNLRFSDNQISILNEDIEIISRVIDGNYPDYRKVIPDKFISKVLVNKEDLEKKSRLAGIFSSNISDIKISCNENNLNLSAKNSDKGEIFISTEASLKGEPFEVSLNYHYLLDGLKIIPTNHVIIEYTGQGSPLILKPEDKESDFIYIIMPLRN